MAAHGPTVLFSDGDAVFQPIKIRRAGLFEAVSGRAAIYIHKERLLDEIERLYPAACYVIIDDKLRILTAIKREWKERVTAIFAKQGHYARDPKLSASFPRADVEAKHIRDLLQLDFASVIAARQRYS